MNKVINGSRYNTETARLLGSASYSHPGDFSYWEEDLYITKVGKYFLYGEGGPMSKYARRVSYNETSGDEVILPMTEEEAREWAEKNLSGDEYEEIFGAPDESGDTVRISSVLLPASLSEQLEARCEELHCTRTDVIVSALRQYFK